MPTFAAVDIGSNSCRLKIAKVVAHQLRSMHEDREVTRLGGSVFESGLVSPEAMANTIQALKRFQRAVQDHGVDQIRVVATSAMRDARNSAAFQAWVKAETGWQMEIISGLEEGRLIHLGVMAGGSATAGKGMAGKVLLVDLGGGSCEITLSDRKRIKETISVPLGAVRLTQDFLPLDPPPEDGLARADGLAANCAVPTAEFSLPAQVLSSVPPGPLLPSVRPAPLKEQRSRASRPASEPPRPPNCAQALPLQFRYPRRWRQRNMSANSPPAWRR